MNSKIPSILLLGETATSEGPAVVTRLYLQALRGLASKGKCEIVWGGNSRHRTRLIAGYARMLPDDCTVVLSGLGYSSGHLKMARRLGRKIIYIMHGCTQIESGGPAHPKEVQAMEAASVIACVSSPFASQMRSLYPDYADKICALPNPVEPLEQHFGGSARDSRRIVLIGGGRRVKGNLQVCEAVGILNSSLATGERPFVIDVYGCRPGSGDDTEAMEAAGAIIHGVEPHAKVLEAMSQAGLYIANSTFEPFGMALTEALVCGADILTSPEVGANDTIAGALLPTDIITRPTTAESLAAQIEYISANGNNARLKDALMKPANTPVGAAERLLNIVTSCG